MNRRQRGVRANHHRRGEAGGELPLKEEEGNHHPRGRMEERRSEPLSYGEVEGIHFCVLEFHSKKGNGRAIQRRQRKEAPPKEGGGRKHHPKEGGDRSDRRKHHRPKGGGEGEVHHSFFVVLPSSSSSGWGCFFPVTLGVVLILLLFPVGWCPSPFSKGGGREGLRLVGLPEVKFSSVEWCTAFLCFLSGGAAWPSPSFGRAASLLGETDSLENNTAQSAQG